MLSKIIKQISPSPTLAISAKASAMKKQGIDIISFGAGEPDFDTPNNIKNAAIKAIQENFTKYTAVSGAPELKDAIINKFKRENNLEYENKNIIASNGGKQILYTIFRTILNPEDEVIVPSPYWVSYKEMIKSCQAKCIEADTSHNNFTLKAELVESLINKKTKAIILNSPSNPTGAIIPKIEAEKIAKLALKNNIYIISDEVYEHFNYSKEKPYSCAQFSNEIKEITIIVNAVSKTYAMTGWRIGYCAANEEIIKAMSAFQSHISSNPCSIAQKAAIEALNGPQDSVNTMKETFKKRRNYLITEIDKSSTYSYINPQGAFYLFLNVSKHFNSKITNSSDFCQDILKKEKLALVPGTAFGQNGKDFIRMSYASSIENLKEGIKRLNSYKN